MLNPNTEAKILHHLIVLKKTVMAVLNMATSKK
jgi:hypothetical protein